ncbi:MAG: hypothetical protein ASARMPRED_009432 [Alectoria sarmentosa]|nr:MAG: hypothetical protein ASARMPRED_009432 [Alectoria sarmentosa]
MEDYDTVATTTSLERVLLDVQGLDTGSAINQAHSSPPPSTHFVIAGRSPLVVQDGSPPAPHDTFAVTESSSVINQTEILHSPDVAFAEIGSQINKAGQLSNVVATDTSQEINEAGSSFEATVAVAEDSSTANEPVEIFRFTDLAPEVRNRIYRFVLGPPQDPSICLTQILDNCPLRFDGSFRPKSVVPNPRHKDPDWGVTHQVKPDDLSILLVSKQIYVEAFHVFYTTNCFSFTDTGLLYRFLKNVGYTRRQHLTMVYFLWRGPDAKEAFRLLKTCRRLTTVQFTVPCSHPPGYEALKEVRVEKAKARALVHFAAAQNPPLNIHDHTSCFGDYLCHCLCRRSYEPASNIRELENAMMRPRREQDLPDTEEKFDLFKSKRERFKKSEEQDLLEEKASFFDYIGRIEQQGKELKYLGRKNKNMEAALNQTLKGSDVDDYFRDFAEKLAADKRLTKRKERWHEKRRQEKEMKELGERLRREADEAKELAIKLRREARELKWKIARETRELAKKMAREARELKRRTAREAKEREKKMARELRAQKKAERELEKRDKKTTKGIKELEKKMVSASI